MTVYETQIMNIGKDAEAFLEEGIIILFGENVPPELKDICYNIVVNKIDGTISKGMNFLINNEPYKITAVGSDVHNNLSDLGHITLNFDGSTKPTLPGTIYLENKKPPYLRIGDKINIL